MPRAILIAGCLFLTLSACKHERGGESDDSINPRVEVRTDGSESDLDVSGTIDRSGDGGAINPRVPVDIEMPELPVPQMWKQGAKSLILHKSSTCPTTTVEDTGCGSETIYDFERASRLLKLSNCDCGNLKSVESKITLTPAQVAELDQRISGIVMVSGPSGACVNNDSNNWELIIKSAAGVDESFPVANGSCTSSQFGKVNAASFQNLFDYLKKTLP